MAQMVEWSLPTPEIRSLNPNIGQSFIYQLYFKIERTNIKKTGRERLTFKKVGAKSKVSYLPDVALLALGLVAVFHARLQTPDALVNFIASPEVQVWII